MQDALVGLLLGILLVLLFGSKLDVSVNNQHYIIGVQFER